MADSGERMYSAASESLFEGQVICQLRCVKLSFAGLIPYTEYTAYVEVCTAVGCGNSPNVTVTTAETTPQGQFCDVNWCIM